MARMRRCWRLLFRVTSMGRCPRLRYFAPLGLGCGACFNSAAVDGDFLSAGGDFVGVGRNSAATVSIARLWMAISSAREAISPALVAIASPQSQWRGRGWPFPQRGSRFRRGWSQ
jgi:hypothetical protein